MAKLHFNYNGSITNEEMRSQIKAQLLDKLDTAELHKIINFIEELEVKEPSNPGIFGV